MTDDRFGDPINSDPWPMPAECVYCNSDNKAVREIFCSMTCVACMRRHFSPPAPKPRSLLDRLRDWWQRVWVGLVGWNMDDA